MSHRALPFYYAAKLTRRKLSYHGKLALTSIPFCLRKNWSDSVLERLDPDNDFPPLRSPKVGAYASRELRDSEQRASREQAESEQQIAKR